MVIYKILVPAEWAAFERDGRFDGSPLDRRSGYVHCSTGAQVGATAHRFFGDEPSLVIVSLDADLLDDLRWEPTASGDTFPHVYGPLPGRAVVAVRVAAGPAEVARLVPPE